ncbi:MAG: PQQ-binding-like beta-propeller repeat protein [Verrucomicrobia bacterium]|nr:MAG: PQQ-binding-like beta-propeller repeat protein [Verrucomicrobiota bacterium]
MYRRFLLVSLLVAAPLAAAAPKEWPQFRGPQGDGLALDAHPPTAFSDTHRVTWHTPVHGKAWASPVVGGGRVWLATATEDATELSVVALDAASGKVLLDRTLFRVAKPQFVHKFNSAASPTPLLAGNRVYVTFGSPGTACLDAKSGNTLWERRDIECNHYRGAGSSPILHQGKLILNFDGSDHQFLVALDAKDGHTVWKTQRGIDYKDLGPDGKPDSEGDWRKAFATCQIATIDGVTQLFSQGAKAFYSYDPADGRERWRVEERTSHSAGTRPVVGHGLVFFPTGWSQGQVLAVHPGNNGEVIDANASTPAATKLSIAWRTKRNVPKKPSLLLLDDLLYGIDETGIATCWEAKTGTVVWNERIGGNYSAAPVATREHLYFCSEEGRVTVVATGRRFAKVAANQLGDGFMASPAIVGNALFLRSRSEVYRID